MQTENILLEPDKIVQNSCEASLLGCIQRLINITFSNELTIHILGATEFESPEYVPKRYNSLLNKLIELDILTLNISFIGPNLRPTDRITTCYKNVMNLNISTDSMLYHDYIDSNLVLIKPDIAVLFNAGLWGYDDWIPTLIQFRPLVDLVVLVTSYTLEEAEDDADVITNTLGNSIKWLWEEEINPYRSIEPLEKRHNVDENRLYLNNHAWQCFQII